VDLGDDEGPESDVVGGGGLFGAGHESRHRVKARFTMAGGSARRQPIGSGCRRAEGRRNRVGVQPSFDLVGSGTSYPVISAGSDGSMRSQAQTTKDKTDRPSTLM
jgi:hypothetical protein